MSAHWVASHCQPVFWNLAFAGHHGGCFRLRAKSFPRCPAISWQGVEWHLRSAGRVWNDTHPQFQLWLAKAEVISRHVTTKRQVSSGSTIGVLRPFSKPLAKSMPRPAQSLSQPAPPKKTGGLCKPLVSSVPLRFVGPNHFKKGWERRFVHACFPVQCFCRWKWKPRLPAQMSQERRRMCMMKGSSESWRPAQMSQRRRLWMTKAFTQFWRPAQMSQERRRLWIMKASAQSPRPAQMSQRRRLWMVKGQRRKLWIMKASTRWCGLTELAWRSALCMCTVRVFIWWYDILQHIDFSCLRQELMTDYLIPQWVQGLFLELLKYPHQRERESKLLCHGHGKWIRCVRLYLALQSKLQITIGNPYPSTSGNNLLNFGAVMVPSVTSHRWPVDWHDLVASPSLKLPRLNLAFSHGVKAESRAWFLSSLRNLAANFINLLKMVPVWTILMVHRCQRVYFTFLFVNPCINSILPASISQVPWLLRQWARKGECSFQP